MAPFLTFPIDSTQFHQEKPPALARDKPEIAV
jgi:hypothetical protein